MNKIALLLLMWLVAVVPLQANDYYILHIKGEIKLKSTGKTLKPNDKITAKDEIVFGSSEAMAAVVSTEGGRMILRANTAEVEEGSSELARFVQHNLMPATGRMSTRDAGVFTVDEDFVRHFTGSLDNNSYYRGQYVILGKQELHTAIATAYPLDDSHLFYVSYTYKGETINKMLASEGNRFILNEREIYEVDDSPIPASEASEFKLYYYDMQEEESRLLCEFIPVFVAEEEIKEALTPLVPHLQKMSKEQRIGEAKAYLADIYGKVGTKDLAKFLDEHFDWK